jgi:hypothetical protein
MTMRSFIGLTLAALTLGGLSYLIWAEAQVPPGGYLFATRSAEAEAGYCLAVLERVGEITRGKGDPRLEQHLTEGVAFWRGRVAGAATEGRAMLARATNAPGMDEGDLVRQALQACADRASGPYGHHFRSTVGL